MSIFERQINIPYNGENFTSWNGKKKLQKVLHANEQQLANATNLVMAFDQGRISLFHELLNNGWKIKIPDLAIKKISPFSFLQEDALHIAIGLKTLESYMNYDPNTWIELKFRKFPDIFFRGKVINDFYLAGIEETFHAAFLQSNDRYSIVCADLYATSAAEYDSEETEYQSLLWQLSLAKKRNFPADTLDVLGERIRNAQAFRSREK